MADRKKDRSQHSICQKFKACRHKRKQQRRASDLFQVRDIQRDACFDQYDDQSDLPKFGGDRQDGWIQQVQRIRSAYDSGEDHADDTRQTQPITDSCGKKTGKNNDC